jgi:DNA processing protein
VHKDELLYAVALTFVPQIGDITARRLIQFCGGPEAVFREKRKLLLSIPGIRRTHLQELQSNEPLRRAEKELKFAAEHKVNIHTSFDSTYPYLLGQCPDAPLVIYSRGNVDWNNRRTLAIVGTRQATDYGKQVVQEMVQDLAEYNPIIVSGLAYGIDICAHRSALKHGLDTMGVLGHGHDTLYPGNHRSVAESMLRQGALLTEYPSGTNPDRENFPARNRIVAGMVQGVLVVEAGEKGGALITAALANSYHREVMAVPGRWNDAWSAGCLALIRTNRAALVQNPGDVALALNWNDQPTKKSAPQLQLFQELSQEEQQLVDGLRAGSKHVDELGMLTQLPIALVNAKLLELELKGMVINLPGKYARLA